MFSLESSMNQCCNISWSTNEPIAQHTHESKNSRTSKRKQKANSWSSQKPLLLHHLVWVTLGIAGEWATGGSQMEMYITGLQCIAYISLPQKRSDNQAALRYTGITVIQYIMTMTCIRYSLTRVKGPENISYHKYEVVKSARVLRPRASNAKRRRQIDSVWQILCKYL
jgi:hypothetical protein